VGLFSLSVNGRKRPSHLHFLDGARGAAPWNGRRCLSAIWQVFSSLLAGAGLKSFLFRQPCHFGHGLFQPLIQGPETLPRGFVFEVQRCSDCGLAKTPCFACARGARARVARWFPAIQFCAFRFCFSFVICARRHPQCSAPPGLRSGPPGLGHPPSPCPGHPLDFLLTPPKNI
jgi:hypothetical protein